MTHKTTDVGRLGVRFRDGSVKDDFMSHVALQVAARWKGCEMVRWDGRKWVSA